MPVKKPPKASERTSRLPQPSRGQPTMKAPARRRNDDDDDDTASSSSSSLSSNDNTSRRPLRPPPPTPQQQQTRKVKQQQQQHSDPITKSSSSSTAKPSSSSTITSFVKLTASPTSEKFSPSNVVFLPSKTMDELKLVVGSLVEVSSASSISNNNNNNSSIILSVMRDSEQDRLKKSSFARMNASTLMTIMDTDNDNTSSSLTVTIRVYTKCDVDDAKEIIIRQRKETDDDAASSGSGMDDNNSHYSTTSTLEQFEMFERSLPRDCGAASLVFPGMVVDCSTRGSRMIQMEIVGLKSSTTSSQKQTQEEQPKSSLLFSSGTKLKTIDMMMATTTRAVTDKTPSSGKNNNNNNNNGGSLLIHFIVGDEGYGKTTKLQTILKDHQQRQTQAESSSAKWISGGGIAALPTIKERVQFLRSINMMMMMMMMNKDKSETVSGRMNNICCCIDDIHLFLTSDELVVVAFCDMLKSFIKNVNDDENLAIELYFSISSSNKQSSSSSTIDDVLPREVLAVLASASSSSQNKIQIKHEALTLPSTQERINILSNLLSPYSIMSTNTNTIHDNDTKRSFIEDLASTAYGYSPLDFKVLLDVALSYQRQQQQENISSSSSTLTESNIRKARRAVQPASLKSITAVAPPPSLSWDDIGGGEEVKRSLRECLAFANEKAQAQFAKFGVSAPRGVLLYGPPGCSKTLCAKCVSSEGKMNFISVKGPEVFSKWVGDSEKAVRDIFDRARAAAPCVVFVDEIDGMCGKRGGGGVGDRVISQLLVELDGLPKVSSSSTSSSSSSSSGIVFIAATNRPDVLDSALLRPGRIDRKIYVGLPNSEDRKQIIRIALRGIPVSKEIEKSNYLDAILASDECTRGYTGAEMVSLCKRAAALAVYEDIDCDAVERKHFEQAMQEVRPRVQAKDIEWYEKWGK